MTEHQWTEYAAMKLRYVAETLKEFELLSDVRRGIERLLEDRPEREPEPQANPVPVQECPTCQGIGSVPCLDCGATGHRDHMANFVPPPPLGMVPADHPKVSTHCGPGEGPTLDQRIKALAQLLDSESATWGRRIEALERQHNRRINHEDTEMFPGIYSRLDNIELRLAGDGSEVPRDADLSYGPGSVIPRDTRINWVLAQERVRRGTP